MSVWTHVAGCIRYDDLRGAGIDLRDFYESLLRGTPPSGIPEGSEGPLQWEIIENPMMNAAASYVVAIWGDLRDFDDLSRIELWFRRCIEHPNAMVRQAVLEAQVEGGKALLIHHRRGENFTNDYAKLEYADPEGGDDASG
jgi:hypothetical protein